MTDSRNKPGLDAFLSWLKTAAQPAAHQNAN